MLPASRRAVIISEDTPGVKRGVSLSIFLALLGCILIFLSNVVVLYSSSSPTINRLNELELTPLIGGKADRFFRLKPALLLGSIKNETET